AKRSTRAGKDTAQVDFTLPELPEGTYGVSWQSIGNDGHRAAGEVVFGVGAVSQNQVNDARFQAVSVEDRLVDAGGAGGRFLWYLGLSLAIGALFVLVWLAGASKMWSDAGRSLWALSRTWLGRGLMIAFIGAAIRLTSTLIILGGAFEGGSTAARLGRALSTGGTMFEVLVLVFLAVAVRFSDRISTTPYLGRSDQRWRNIAASVVLEVLAGSVGGHLAVNRAPEIAIAVSSAHILAAALWIGPLCVIALWLAASQRSELPAGERSAVISAFFPGFARAAGWSLLVLVLTGAEALWANIGTNLFGNRYGLALSAKLLLLAVVILPLAWAHDQKVRDEPAKLAEPRFGRSLRLEIGALTTVLVLASSLAVLNPTAGGEPTGGGDTGEDVLAAEPVSDVQECAGLNVGQQNCYQTYFSEVMKREDPGAAVAEVLELSGNDQYVATQCHQITHDLGREAAGLYDTLGEALSFEASACWSGYYHGVVEQRMSEFDDAELLKLVPEFCEDPAKDQYSFVHYNCVHGVGHGIMLRFEADLFASIPYCEKYRDQWELSSCISGAIMQNVVSAQEGHTGATFREGDLVYPCNEIANQYKDECFGMQTSYILWQSNQDLAKGFEICDTVEADFADDCYQSMGRDISGNSLLDSAQVVSGCALGGAALREHCIVGASLNAVFNDHPTKLGCLVCVVVVEHCIEGCADYAVFP
ncbi:MAG TPA: CopD family protein, partial [Actinomycetota bacterium]|nr:CopD family protein [Actinomycetota bacterium]